MSIKPRKKIDNEDGNKTYPQDWVAYNQAQTQEKILFLELLHDLTSQIPRQKNNGRGRTKNDIAIELKFIRDYRIGKSPMSLNRFENECKKDRNKLLSDALNFLARYLGSKPSI